MKLKDLEQVNGILRKYIAVSKFYDAAVKEMKTGYESDQPVLVRITLNTYRLELPLPTCIDAVLEEKEQLKMKLEKLGVNV